MWVKSFYLLLTGGRTDGLTQLLNSVKLRVVQLDKTKVDKATIKEGTQLDLRVAVDPAPGPRISFAPVFSFISNS